MHAVAAELSRRGYDAAITLGNTPTIDIVCASPKGTPFKVQVKSASGPNWVRVRREHLIPPVDNDLFFIIVLIPKDVTEPFRFHILRHGEICKNFSSQSPLRRDGKPLAPGGEGLAWAFVNAGANHWEKLPG